MRTTDTVADGTGCCALASLGCTLVDHGFLSTPKNNKTEYTNNFAAVVIGGTLLRFLFNGCNDDDLLENSSLPERRTGAVQAVCCAHAGRLRGMKSLSLVIWA
jgi:hypothetical protein